jgi:hypothetical protein
MLGGFIATCLSGGLLIFGHAWPPKQECYNRDNYQIPQHNAAIVPQKLLTPSNYWGTLNTARRDMANMLNTDKQIAIIAALSEGSSIRSIERMTGVHRDTIMRLGVKVGQGCTALLKDARRS